jgi:hypothetical protein
VAQSIQQEVNKEEEEGQFLREPLLRISHHKALQALCNSTGDTCSSRGIWECVLSLNSINSYRLTTEDTLKMRVKERKESTVGGGKAL